jgi:DNA-binding protein H-NS
MPRRSFESSTVQALLELREQVAAELGRRRTQLEAQIAHLDGSAAIAMRRGRAPGRKAHAVTGRKVPPKYRGPKGETWAGRGVAPLWLVELMKQGRKKEEFAIDKGTAPAKRAAARKKRVVKRGRRRKK